MTDEKKYRTLTTISSDGELFPCRLIVANSEPWYLIYEDHLSGSFRFDGDDLFECLKSLRKFLEERGSRILCCGAKVNVYPSGMSRDMSGGRLAYKIKLGKATEREDIVDIFEAVIDPSEIETVENQEEYHRLWAHSLQTART